MNPPANGAALHLEACMVCGTDLEYRETGMLLPCAICGLEEIGHVCCPDGHYVCERCHGGTFPERLQAAVAATRETSPFRLAEDLLLLPGLPMLGCEHAAIAAAAVMGSLRNRGDAGVTDAHVQEALERTGRQAISAYCGLSGVCGIVPALGACLSVLVGAQCGRGPQTRMTMELVSRLAALTAAEADPGCCKAYLRTGIREFAAFADERLGLSFSDPEPAPCRDVDRHPHGCRGPECAYHPEAAQIADDSPQGTAAPSAAASPRFREEPRMPTTGPASQARYQDFFDLVYADGALDARTKILVSLGASLAAGCGP